MKFMMLTNIILMTTLISGGIGYLVFKLSKKHSAGLLTTMVVGFIIPFVFQLPIAFIGIILGGIVYGILVGRKKMTTPE